MAFRLILSVNILRLNYSSYLKFANDNIQLFDQQNRDFVKDVLSDDPEKAGWGEINHLQNAHWLFLNSIYVSMYFAFEHFLQKIILTADAKNRNRVKFKHIGGMGILERYLNYLHLVVGLKSADPGNAVWRELKKFKEVRDLLVHQGGILTSPGNPIKTKIFPFLKEYNVEVVGSTGLIRIRSINILKAFSDHSINIAEILISDLKDIQLL